MCRDVIGDGDGEVNRQQQEGRKCGCMLLSVQTLRVLELEDAAPINFASEVSPKSKQGAATSTSVTLHCASTIKRNVTQSQYKHTRAQFEPFALMSSSVRQKSRGNVWWMTSTHASSLPRSHRDRSSDTLDSSGLSARDSAVAGGVGGKKKRSE